VVITIPATSPASNPAEIAFVLLTMFTDLTRLKGGREIKLQPSYKSDTKAHRGPKALRAKLS
jgi:hypothetical protein